MENQEFQNRLSYINLSRNGHITKNECEAKYLYLAIEQIDDNCGRWMGKEADIEIVKALVATYIYADGNRKFSDDEISDTITRLSPEIAKLTNEEIEIYLQNLGREVKLNKLSEDYITFFDNSSGESYKEKATNATSSLLKYGVSRDLLIQTINYHYEENGDGEAKNFGKEIISSTEYGSLLYQEKDKQHQSTPDKFSITINSHVGTDREEIPKSNINIAFQKEGGPYRFTAQDYFEEDGTEKSTLRLHKSNELIKTQTIHSEDDKSYESFYASIANELKQNHPEYMDEKKYLESRESYPRNTTVEQMQKAADQYIEDINQLYKEGTFGKNTRDLEIEMTKKFQEKLETVIAVDKNANLTINNSINDTHEIFALNKTQLESQLNKLIEKNKIDQLYTQGKSTPEVAKTLLTENYTPKEVTTLIMNNAPDTPPLSSDARKWATFIIKSAERETKEKVKSTGIDR